MCIKNKVDVDILKSLKALYFGDFTNPIKAASDRAYRDMNRTIRFVAGVSKATRDKLKDEVYKVFVVELKDLNSKNIKSQDDFDKWHKKVSDEIKKIYSSKVGKDNGGYDTLTYGQTQKWINMTIKYLYILEAYSFSGVFKFLHIPLDKYILNIVEDKLKISRPILVWSRWDNYDEYLEYQKLIRDKIKPQVPLRWEFREWLDAARNIMIND